MTDGEGRRSSDLSVVDSPDGTRLEGSRPPAASPPTVSPLANTSPVLFFSFTSILSHLSTCISCNPLACFRFISLIKYFYLELD